MSEYGYIPEAPEQSFGNNKGIFNPKDIYDLTRADKYTNYGQLELIETQTASADSSVQFTDIKEDIYNVHFITCTMTESTTPFQTRISNNGGSSYISSGYQFAGQYGNVTGTFGEDKTTNGITFIEGGSGGTGLAKNLYAYMYNLGDSSKYSFSTSHQFSEHSSLGHYFSFYSSVYPSAEVHNAIEVFAVGTITGTVSLYGIKEYS